MNPNLQLRTATSVIADYSICNTVSSSGNGSNLISMDESLGAYVERKIEEQGLKQNQLAERSGIPATTINRIKQGVTKLPAADIRRRLAHGLGVSHLDILIAAGEITRKEVASEGIETRDACDGVPSQLLSVIRQYQWDDASIESVVSVLRATLRLNRRMVEQNPDD